MSDDRERKIRERAYQNWQEEGEPHGRDVEHWHRAADEIDRRDASEADAQPDLAPSGEMAPTPPNNPSGRRKRQPKSGESGAGAYHGDKPSIADEAGGNAVADEEEIVVPGAGENSGGESEGKP